MKFVHNSSIVAVMVVLSAQAADASVPDYDFEWATIGDPGNAGWDGEVQSSGTGRGAVDYTYRISKYEVRSDQWLEFMQTIGPVVGNSRFAAPVVFGYTDFFPGEYVPDAPFPETTPVHGITWRTAAMYCNWLHNDKEASLAAISNGAYDISTFGDVPDPVHGTRFTDQLTHNPDAKFWIPTLDEWIKAAHYDPDKNGEGEGGYWMYSHTSDTAPIPGAPGVGETSAAVLEWELDGNTWGTDYIPLGAYPDVTSPWGLYDTSGGASEWTEEALFGVLRRPNGTWAGVRSPTNLAMDRIDVAGGIRPDDLRSVNSLRVASAIPAPAPTGIGAAGLCALVCRRPRRSGVPG